MLLSKLTSSPLENLSKIFYMVGLFALISLSFFEPEDPEGALIMTVLILQLLSAFVVGEVTLRGKESLYIYKKTPSGVGRFIVIRKIIVLPITCLNAKA